MIYPALFFIPGFFILAFSTLQRANLVVGIVTGLVCMVAFVFQSWRWMGVVLAIGLLAGFVTGETGLAGTAVANGIGWLLVTVALASRCPRCEYTLAPSRSLSASQPPARWCPMCGRTRRGVWPFQYLIRRESWDGDYHDEGGGPTRQDGIRDWWRDILFKRYQKRKG